MFKKVQILLSAMFLYFAFLQLNDPDTTVWVAMYVLMALLPLVELTKKYKTKIYTIILFVLALWFGTFIDDLYHWTMAGFPSVLGDMEAGVGRSELIREAGGLFICCLVLVWYMRKSKTA